MISNLSRWLTRTLLTNSRTKDIVASNDHIMCILFNLMHPGWLLAKVTEKLSPWFDGTTYKNTPIQVQRVYHPICGIAWNVRVLDSSKGWNDLGTIHPDLQVLFQIAFEYIDEVKFCELTEKIEKLIQMRSERLSYKHKQSD